MMRFSYVRSCGWKPSEWSNGDADATAAQCVAHYVDTAAKAYDAACAGLSPKCAEWFSRLSAGEFVGEFSPQQKVEYITEGWFTLAAVSEVAFYFHKGRLDAFFTSEDAAAKFTVQHSDGRRSVYRRGFCITKDITKSAVFPVTDLVYWRKAVALATSLDAFCLVAGNKSVAALLKENYNEGQWDDALFNDCCWDESFFVGQPIAMTFIARIVADHSAHPSRSRARAAYSAVKRSRLLVTIGRLMAVREALDAEGEDCEMSRESAATLRRTLTETEHFVRHASYYYDADLPEEVADGILNLLSAIHTQLDDARLVVHPGAVVAASTRNALSLAADSTAAAAADDRFLVSPLHTFSYVARPPRSDLIAFDSPCAEDISFNAHVDDWYSVRDKMRAVLTYAQQLFHSRSEHVGNGKRLAFEVISQFVLGALPLPLPDPSVCPREGDGEEPAHRQCFWFEPRDPRTGAPVTRYDESLRKDIVDILNQLTYVAKMCPQATASAVDVTKDPEGGGGRGGKGAGTEAHAVTLSSTASVVFVSMLAIADAVLRVLLPADIAALRSEVERNVAPRSMADMTRVLNGFPWGGSAKDGAAVGCSIVPDVSALLAAASFNLSSPQLIAQVRACHAYFSSVQPNAELSSFLARRNLPAASRKSMGASSVRAIVASATAPFYCEYAANIKNIRPGLFPQIGTTCTAYIILLDNCFAFISNTSTCNYLPSYVAVHAGPERGPRPSHWTPRPHALAPSAEEADVMASEMDVIHLRQLIDDCTASVDNVERVAASVVARGVSLRVFLSIISTNPRVLESPVVYRIMALLLSSSTTLDGTPQCGGMSPEERQALPLGNDSLSPSSRFQTSQCGLILEEIIAYPEELFALVHRLIAGAVECTSGTSFDSARSRMLCRVVMVVVQLVECAIFVLETDPVDRSLACPFTFVDGISDVHRDRREALSVQARHAMGMLYRHALPRLREVIAARESMPKPTALLFPEPSKLVTAVLEFGERQCDLVHLHMAVVTIVGPLLHNQSARWFAPEVVLGVGAGGVGSGVTMRSSTDAFWPAQTIIERLNTPLIPEVDCPHLSDILIAGAGSASYLQNMDMQCAFEVVASDSTAVDLLCRHIRLVMRFVVISVQAAQTASSIDFGGHDVIDNVGAQHAIAAVDFTTKVANEMVASATALGLILRDETGEAVVKVRGRHARFIAAGGVWSGDAADYRRRFIFKASIDRAVVRDANADLAELLKIPVSVEAMRPTLPLTTAVRLDEVISECFPPSLVDSLVSSGVKLSCIVPQVATAVSGPAVTTISSMGKLTIHTSPKIIASPAEVFRPLPDGDGEGLPASLFHLSQQLTVGQDGVRASEGFSRGALIRACFRGPTAAMGTCVAEVHAGAEYLGRESLVVGVMRRLGDVAYTEAFDSSSPMFRSVVAFCKLTMASIYVGDGEAFLKARYAANSTDKRNPMRGFEDAAGEALPKHSSIAWPKSVYSGQNDVVSMIHDGEDRSSSISRVVPTWLASCSLPALPDGGAWCELLLPYAAVRSYVPNPIVDSHVWFMMVPRGETLHQTGSAAAAEGATAIIHGYPIPQNTSFSRASHALNWLEDHLFTLDDDSACKNSGDGPRVPKDFRFIRVVVFDGLSSKVTEEHVVAQQQQHPTGRTSFSSSSPVTVRTTRRVLVSPYSPSLSALSRRLFTSLFRIVPLNEVVAWRDVPVVAQGGIAAKGGGDGAPDLILIPCVNLTFDRDREVSHHYACQQFPEFFADVAFSDGPCAVPPIFRAFERGTVPFGLVLKGCSAGRFGLLLPVMDGANGYTAVEMIQLTPSNDDFIPPTPEAAACLLMCLFRYLPSPMAAIPAVRAAFVNAGHFSPTQEAFLRMFIEDLRTYLEYGAAHHIVDELDACCPTYATDLRAAAVSYTSSDAYFAKYMTKTIMTVKPQHRMAGPKLFPRVCRYAQSLSDSWEKERFMDTIGLFGNAALSEQERSSHPFGKYESSTEQYWYLSVPRNTAVVGLGPFDDLGHGTARCSISNPTDGNVIEFCNSTNLTNAQLAGFLKLRVAMTNSKLFFEFSTMRNPLSYTNLAEAEACGLALRSLRIETFTHHYTTRESRIVQEFNARTRRWEDERVYYDQPRTRTAFKDKSGVEALRAHLAAQPLRELPAVHVGGCLSFASEGTPLMYVPDARFTAFIGTFSPSLVSAGEGNGKVTVALPSSALGSTMGGDGVLEPFGGDVAAAVSAFPRSGSSSTVAGSGGSISPFGELPYVIDTSDGVSQKAVEKQRTGLSAFAAAMKNVVVRTCHPNRANAVTAFAKLFVAVEKRRDVMSAEAERTREALFRAERDRVFTSPLTELNAIQLSDGCWATMGALLRGVLASDDGADADDATIRNLIFAHLFASHAAMVLSDLLVQVKDLLKMFTSDIATKSDARTSALAPSEMDAANGILRMASSTRVYVDRVGSSSSLVTFDPICLYFEWCDRKILRDTQYGLLVKIQRALREEASPAEVHQLLMGEGKSSVIIPILALRICQPKHLMIVSCPNQLVKAAERNLLATTLGPLTRDLMTLSVNRERDLDSDGVTATTSMRERGGIILAAPNTLKCVFSLNPLDIANDPKRGGKSHLEVYAKAIQLLRDAPLILDEVDDTCDPMRSSLIFPCGDKGPLHEALLRWRFPTMMLHILHSVSGLIGIKRATMSTVAPTAAVVGATATTAASSTHLPQKQISDVLPPELKGNAALVCDVEVLMGAIERALAASNMTLDPHLLLATEDAFEVYLLEPLRPIAASILALPIVGATSLPRDDVVALLSEKRSPAMEEHFEALPSTSRCAINLAVEWLYSLLPHVLRKQHRVQFGVVGLSDVAYLEERAIEAGQDPTISIARTILAVPFEGKDQPSLSSEFSHPDVVIGLSITAHILSPLARDRDAGSLIRRLRVELSEDSAPMTHREAFKRFNSFMREGLLRILSAKGIYARDLYEKLARNDKYFGAAAVAPNNADANDNDGDGDGVRHTDRVTQVLQSTKGGEVIERILADLGTLDRVSDAPQSAAEVYEVLRNSISAACFFCVNISSEHLRLNPYTFTACGGDLLSTVTFTKRIGFSGTASDMIPHEVPKGCQDQAESEGKASSVLLCPHTSQLYLASAAANTVSASAKANDAVTAPLSIEDQIQQAIAAAENKGHGVGGGFNAIIDVGAMLTQSNEEVARWLLSILPKDRIKGCVFFRRDDTKVVLLRDSDRVLPLEMAGLRKEEQFVFYDQVHTRGQDVKHHPTARALVLLGMKGDLDLNALAQGVFRMRGLGSGQRLTLYVPLEVQAAIRRMCAAGVIKNTPPAAPITNALVHAWTLCNLIRQTRIARVALKYENARRLLVKPFMARFNLHDGSVYGKCAARTFRDPVGFRLSDDFVPAQPSLYDSCVTLSNRFEECTAKWSINYGDAKAYVEALNPIAIARASGAGAGAADAMGGGGIDARELDALMEKDQQEYKVKEKEVDKVVNVQDGFSREGERYREWTVLDATAALFGSVDFAEQAPSNNGSSSSPLFVTMPAYMSAPSMEASEGRLVVRDEPPAAGRRDNNRVNGDAVKKTPASLLCFSPNFYPYPSDVQGSYNSRRVRPLNFILEVTCHANDDSVSVGLTGRAQKVLATQTAADDLTAVKEGGAVSSNKVRHQGTLTVFGELPANSNHNADAYADDNERDATGLSQFFTARRFVVVTLAEAVGVRHLIEGANRSGVPLVPGFSFALRDFNHFLIPAYTERGFTDDLPSIPFNSLSSVLNFVDGSPLFSVLSTRMRINSSPLLSAPLALSAPIPLLKESSAAYFVLRWLGQFAQHSRGACFERLTRELRRPDAAKLDWRLHSGAVYSLSHADGPHDALTSRLLAVQILFCAKARGWGLAELQLMLDPQRRGFISVGVLSELVTQTLAMPWVSMREVTLLSRLLDHDMDGAISYDDLQRCLEGFTDGFPSAIVV